MPLPRRPRATTNHKERGSQDPWRGIPARATVCNNVGYRDVASPHNKTTPILLTPRDSGSRNSVCYKL